MALLGALVMLTVIAQINVLGRSWDIHTMVAGAMLLIVGTQVLALGLSARAYGVYVLGERDPWFERMRCPTAAGARAAARRRRHPGRARRLRRDRRHLGERGFGALSEARLAVLAATLIIIGIQIFFSSFLLSILGLRRR